MNAFAERWVQSVKRKCLSQLIIFGEQHLRRVLNEYVAHYNAERPHQGLGNRLVTQTNGEPPNDGEFVADKRLGGLLRSYRRGDGLAPRDKLVADFGPSHRSADSAHASIGSLIIDGFAAANSRPNRVGGLSGYHGNRLGAASGHHGLILRIPRAQSLWTAWARPN